MEDKKIKAIHFYSEENGKEIQIKKIQNSLNGLKLILKKGRAIYLKK
jgi:hypothetical protein